MMATDKDVDDTSGSCQEIYDAPRVDRTRAFLFSLASATLCNLSPPVHFLLHRTKASSDNCYLTFVSLTEGFRYSLLKLVSCQNTGFRHFFCKEKKNDRRKIILCYSMQNVIQEYCWSITYELKGITNDVNVRRCSDNAHK